MSGNAHTPEGSIYFLTLGTITDPGTGHGHAVDRPLGGRPDEHLHQ